MTHEAWLDVGGLVALLLAAAFFAGSETALTGASRARMHALEGAGDKRATLVNKLREKKEKLIGALLLGSTLSSVFMGSLSTALTIATVGEKYVVPVTFGIATLLLIFSEVMPKTYALIHADSVALLLSRPVQWVVALFSPVTHGVEKIVNWFFHLLGVDKSGQSAEAQEEELRGAIALLGESHDDAHEEREESQEKRAMLKSVLDLADVAVEEIMVHRKNVEMINADLPVEQIVDAVLHSSFTRMPMWRESPDNIVGVVHTKLLLQELRSCNGDAAKVKIDNATMEPWFIPESTVLFDQLQAFRRRGERFAIMVDEYGALMGVVTLEDILEEIVGKMQGEHEPAVQGLEMQLDGSLIVDGHVTIRDLNREMHWDIPDEDYSTVAGLLLFETQRIPNVGQTYNFYDFRFDVLKRQRNQVTQVRITPPAEKEKRAIA